MQLHCLFLRHAPWPAVPLACLRYGQGRRSGVELGRWHVGVARHHDWVMVMVWD